MSTRLPLSALLSQLLVAFTIEFDNEFELATPHRTTDAPSASQGVWLVSMVMWSNFMRLVPDEGVTAGELRRLARTEDISLAGMERWGYVTVTPPQPSVRGKSPRESWVIRPTARGREAKKVWHSLAERIERRWNDRFGNKRIDAVENALRTVSERIPGELPEYLPVLSYGLLTKLPPRDRRAPASDDIPAQHLAMLTSRVLLSLAIEFEALSPLSLSVCANVVRVLDEGGVRTRDLPALAGVSKEGIKMALGILEKGGYVATVADPVASRTRLVCLTAKGKRTRDECAEVLVAIERGWEKEFGFELIRALRESLEALVGDGTSHGSPLLRGLEFPPGVWRASRARPATLPHYPMVLHRGGYPDGS